IWKGKRYFTAGNETLFAGDGNSGLQALVGSEFAHYKNLCCVFFNEVDLGHSDSIPNFTFEVTEGI
ncbi:unnamed protein product, partial [marine sediment metagenome]